MPENFWESLRSGFMQLRLESAIDPPLAPAGRLTAIWTAQPDPGRWRLNYHDRKDGGGITERFRWHAQNASARLRFSGKEEEAVSFWLDQLKGSAPAAYIKPIMINSGPEGEYQLYSIEILDICGLAAEFCRKCAGDETLTATESQKLQSVKDHKHPNVEQEVLKLIEGTDREAADAIRSAIRSNGGVIPGPMDLDTGGVGFAQQNAWLLGRAANSQATHYLYTAYADRKMICATSAASFIATLDVVSQQVEAVLKDRTDREMIIGLRQKWSTVANRREDVGWFMRRAPKATLGAPVNDRSFWGDLEKRFNVLSKEFGDRLLANWTSSAWGNGDQWYLGGPLGRERETFAALAERAAVGLGHPPGEGTMAFWLDRLKGGSFNFVGGYQGTDAEGNISYGGAIRRPSEASAHCCFKMETGLVGHTLLPEEPNPRLQTAAKLNTKRIVDWMEQEGYSNEDLASCLKVSKRVVSSLRNDGRYHGADAVTKLGNLMKLEVADLYLP